jgi:hypothetical protein
MTVTVVIARERSCPEPLRDGTDGCHREQRFAVTPLRGHCEERCDEAIPERPARGALLACIVPAASLYNH